MTAIVRPPLTSPGRNPDVKWGAKIGETLKRGDLRDGRTGTSGRSCDCTAICQWFKRQRPVEGSGSAEFSCCGGCMWMYCTPYVWDCPLVSRQLGAHGFAPCLPTGLTNHRQQQPVSALFRMLGTIDLRVAARDHGALGLVLSGQTFHASHELSARWLQCYAAVLCCSCPAVGAMMQEAATTSCAAAGVPHHRNLACIVLVCPSVHCGRDIPASDRESSVFSRRMQMDASRPTCWNCSAASNFGLVGMPFAALNPSLRPIESAPQSAPFSFLCRWRLIRLELSHGLRWSDFRRKEIEARQAKSFSLTCLAPVGGSGVVPLWSVCLCVSASVSAKKADFLESL